MIDDEKLAELQGKFQTLAAEQDKAKGCKPRKALDLKASPKDGWWVLRFDGGCSRNGTTMAKGNWGCRLADGHDDVVEIGKGYVTGNLVTNNVAEWQGLIGGLLIALEHKDEFNGLLIQGDSQLVVKMVAGDWEGKADHMKALRSEAWEVLYAIGKPWNSGWIPRKNNAFCDSLTRN